MSAGEKCNGCGENEHLGMCLMSALSRAKEAEARVAELDARLAREQEMRKRIGASRVRDRNRIVELEAGIRACLDAAPATAFVTWDGFDDLASLLPDEERKL